MSKLINFVCRSRWYRLPIIPIHRSLSIDSQANIFDSATKITQRNRACLTPDPHIFDYLREEMAERMVDRVCDIKRKFNKVVDYGCGRGHIAKQLDSDLASKLFQCDSAENVLAQAAPCSDVETENILLRDELFPFEENSIDLIISSLSLHWVNDLPGVFFQMQQSLKNDGCLLGVMFAGDTLFELRVALQLAETERQGGMSPHISPFTTNQDLGSLLTRTGFNLITIDVDEIVVHYPSLLALLTDLKGMGENNCVWNRKLRLNKDTLLATEAIYKEMYGIESEVNDHTEALPATFQLLHFIAWKPDPSQAKPASRGSGEFSLKDIHHLAEVTKNKKPKRS